MIIRKTSTHLPRTTVRAVVIMALIAVAAALSTHHVAVASAECPYQPNPGDQADLWLNMGGEDIYFTDAEWPSQSVKTFSLDGPFRGDVNIWTFDWGITTSTNPDHFPCKKKQYYTVNKNVDSMPIYLKRCNNGLSASLNFGVTYQRKCIANAGQSITHPMFITETAPEATFLSFNTGGENGLDQTGTTMPGDTCLDHARRMAGTAPIQQTSEQPSDDDAQRETALEYRKRIGVTLIRQEDDGSALFRTLAGRIMTYTEMYAQYGLPLENKNGHSFYVALEACLKVTAQQTPDDSPQCEPRDFPLPHDVDEVHQEHMGADGRFYNTIKWLQGIGASFQGWSDPDDPYGSDQIYLTARGEYVTFTELHRLYDVVTGERRPGLTAQETPYAHESRLSRHCAITERWNSEEEARQKALSVLQDPNASETDRDAAQDTLARMIAFYQAWSMFAPTFMADHDGDPNTPHVAINAADWLMQRMEDASTDNEI